ncbi:unnamed protein product [Cuscuta epithymum]|uniref:Uncharacterized protein n=1 Tax=Cuscuta epithymum TaxID=186058 RepID=A0AAV0DPN5_9ASTE|nr:unnamed protein product [Cuscuta epithymum]CAH9142023.1 unnamed protein product [Cuscuta epithymum]
MVRRGPFTLPAMVLPIPTYRLPCIPCLSPPDENWYMDIEAMFHMMPSSGTLTPYFNLSTNSPILVGNGSSLPVMVTPPYLQSTNSSPLLLFKVLHAPRLIKNLIYVHLFTFDNNVSVEFDLFGISVTDLHPVSNGPSPASHTPSAMMHVSD